MRHIQQHSRFCKQCRLLFRIQTQPAEPSHPELTRCDQPGSAR
jgi:hypothetical protein